MKTLLFFLFLVPCTLVAQHTWRVDYYHTGGPGLETFSLDRVVVEPLEFPGNSAGYVEQAQSGNYRFEVRGKAGKVLYSRGYSSIFAEWTSTDEAGKINRTFHESLRFPAPTSTVDVVVLKRDKKNAFVEVWRTTVDPTDMFIERAAPPKAEVIPIETHGKPQNKVDILLLGDGYTAAQKKKFQKDAKRLVNILFATEPFKSRRNDFNVWGICPPSAKSGISRPSTGFHNATPFGSTYDFFGSERYVLTAENRTMREIASWAPYEFVEILVNNETYGGGGIHGQFATVAVDNDWAPYIFVHEFGHHFAGLADEYYTSPVAYQAPTDVVEPWEPNVTALLDPANLKWKSLLTKNVPVPTPWPKEQFEKHQRDIQKRRVQIRAEKKPESVMSALFKEEQKQELALFGAAEHAKSVGAFQGANYDAKIYYRPQMDCIMFTRNPVPFCAACVKALSDVIDACTGER